jgi:hypothetical protein
MCEPCTLLLRQILRGVETADATGCALPAAAAVGHGACFASLLRTGRARWVCVSLADQQMPFAVLPDTHQVRAPRVFSELKVVAVKIIYQLIYLYIQ